VPSSFASRLIQEELAKQAPNGVLLPVFQTPTEFLNWGDRSSGAKVQNGQGPMQMCKSGDNGFTAASSADALMAWIEVLQATDRSTLPHLFPNANEGLGGI
jgi:hypothetical protein